MTTPPPDLTALRERAAMHEHYSRHRDMEIPSSTVLALLDRLEKAEAKVLAVRELHAPWTVSDAWGTQGHYLSEQRACAECTSPDDAMPTLRPCRTIAALDGGA